MSSFTEYILKIPVGLQAEMDEKEKVGSSPKKFLDMSGSKHYKNRYQS